MKLLPALYCGHEDGGGGDQKSPIHKPEQMVKKACWADILEYRDTLIGSAKVKCNRLMTKWNLWKDLKKKFHQLQPKSMEETLKNLKASLTEIEESQNKKNIFETMKNIKTSILNLWIAIQVSKSTNNEVWRRAILASNLTLQRFLTSQSWFQRIF